MAGTVSVVSAAPATVVNPSNASASAVSAPAAAGVAADVNGEKIMVGDLERRIQAVKASEPSLQTDAPAAQKALADIRGRMLDDLITIRLLSQEARRRKIVAPAKDVDNSMAQLKKQFKSDADFTAWLTQNGITQNDLRTRISDELAMDELSTQATADVTVSGDDIAAYYRAHTEEFTIPAAIKARHILLAINPGASPADKELVKKRAQNLLAQLKKGADFSALAKANSDDQSNKDQGGDLGVFQRGQMVPAFEQAAFGAKTGDLVGPVETNFGYHIIKIDGVFPARTVELKEVQDDPRLKALILREKKQDRFDAFVADLKAKSKIQKYV